MKYTYDQFKKLNFSDFNIESMTLDKVSKIVTIKIEGARLKENYDWLVLSHVLIKIYSWYEISILLYETNNSTWLSLNQDEYDPLKEICETNTDNKLTLKGFGKRTGQWVEYIFFNAKIEISFDKSNS